MSKDRNDHARSLLSKSLDELQILEDKGELILSFSHGICLLMQKTSATQLLTAVTKNKINRETDPFNDHSGSMFTYTGTSIFFKISHHQNTANIEIGLYSEIALMRLQRSSYEWFALSAITDL